MSLPTPNSHGTYETFDHTADVGLRIHASTLDALFATAARALVSYIVVHPDIIESRVHFTVDLRADSIEELLVAWLNELIFLAETRHHVFGGFEVNVDADRPALCATISGEPLDPPRHVPDHEVKAVTRHGATISKTEDGWSAEFILDI